MGVFIAGKGIITSIGANTQENFASLIAAKSGIGNMEILQSNFAGVIPVAEVKLTNSQLAAIAGIDAHSPRTALLSTIAAKEAVLNSGIDLKKWRVGFLSANTVGGMDKTEQRYQEYLTDKSGAELTGVVQHDCGTITELAADALGIRHFVTTISTACSSSANSIMYAQRLIQAGIIDVAVAGGADSLSRFTLNGFNALMILDRKLCTPFDEHRNGLNLGEGAAYLVLASEKVMNDAKREKKYVLSGYANANDAFHQTASSPEGKGNFLAMTKALEVGKLLPEEISYINLHGTGTNNNDVSEGTAIQRIFKKVPPASSTKSFTGHTLGASGSVEAVYSLLAMEHGVVYPNLRFATPMKELNFTPVTTLLENADIKHVMSNSFGFGGNCSSLIFSKCS
ncbi:MAG: beta-ketoacyl-[acyl-carrier-protein] synthase family protein [Chitinophagales bacterium]|nr:beta-ketoacyl-[acyl-carrier-protein] synthase family protein [Chitinophagales bacterium]